MLLNCLFIKDYSKTCDNLIYNLQNYKKIRATAKRLDISI
jgi:hypothetical protein